MSFMLQRQVLAYALTPSETLVLSTMAMHADEAGVAWPSYDRISWETNIDRKRVVVTINRLIKRGLLELVQKGGGRGHSNLYRVALEKGVRKEPKGRCKAEDYFPEKRESDKKSGNTPPFTGGSENRAGEKGGNSHPYRTETVAQSHPLSRKQGPETVAAVAERVVSGAVKGGNRPPDSTYIDRSIKGVVVVAPAPPAEKGGAPPPEKAQQQQTEFTVDYFKMLATDSPWKHLGFDGITHAYRKWRWRDDGPKTRRRFEGWLEMERVGNRPPATRASPLPPASAQAVNTANYDTSCPHCFGSRLEVVPGKGARPCPRCKPGVRWRHEPISPEVGCG